MILQQPAQFVVSAFKTSEILDCRYGLDISLRTAGAASDKRCPLARKARANPIAPPGSRAIRRVANYRAINKSAHAHQDLEAGALQLIVSFRALHQSAR
jgi:hypothetical protein